MALALESIQQFNFDGLHLLMIAAAILVPLFTFWLMISWLAPSFSNKLASLGIDSTGKKQASVSTNNHKSISERLSRIFCPTKTEQAGFESVWKITGRDKVFKMQFYPSMAYMLVFIFIIVFKSGQDMSAAFSEMSDTKKFLVFVYLPMLSIPAGIVFITYYENFQASWIYQSTPISKPGLLVSGALKTLIVKFLIPVFLAFFAFSFYIWGPAILDDFLLGFFNNLIILFVIASLGDQWLPFSRQQNAKQQVGRFVQMIIQMFVIGALVGLHALVLMTDWLIYCLIPIAIAASYLLLKRIQNIKWQKISF
jgi:hypothetical protein